MLYICFLVKSIISHLNRTVNQQRGFFFTWKHEFYVMFRWGAPVTSLKLKIQAAASRPTPQTQNRGRRRVCLGLLGALIPPAAGSPLRRTCRLAAAPPPPHTALLCVHAESNCSAFPLFSPPIYRLWDILALVSIHDPGGCSRGSARHQHLSIQHQSVCQHRRSSSVHMHKLKTPADTQWIISQHLYIYIYM